MENSSPAPVSDPATALRVAHDRQNFTLGLLGGFVAMLAGTALWVVITVVTNFQIGYMAIGIGLLVGLAVQKLGHGFEIRFRALGAGLSLLGCVLGNLFTGCELLAIESKVSLGQVVSGLTPTLAWAVLQVTFSPMDLLFYALGATAGWKYAAIPAPVASAAPAPGPA